MLLFKCSFVNHDAKVVFSVKLAMKQCIDTMTALSFLLLLPFFFFFFWVGQGKDCFVGNWQRKINAEIYITIVVGRNKQATVVAFLNGVGERRWYMINGGHCTFDNLNKLLMSFFLYSTISYILHQKDIAHQSSRL